MLYYLLVVLYVLVCFLLLLVVLLQQGKGGDMASAFGGGGSSQTAFGARAGATVLTRATTILGALFMIGAIVIGIYGQRGPGSVLSGVRGPSQPASTQQPPPAQQPKK
jgi:preprotein translocase subunit SecG